MLSSILTPKVINANFQEVIITGKFCLLDKTSVRVVKTVKMVVTAYTSDPWETDDTPEVMASNNHVYWGAVANNGEPFGTKIRIPEIYGDQVFVVEDRLHKRKGNYMVDIWMPDKQTAKNFGAKWNVKIEILES